MPFYPQSAMSQGTCPNSLLFHYFHLRLAFKSIKEVGNASNMLDRFNKAKYFRRIDFKLGYYQIHIVDEDNEKMVMKIRYNSYEFLVMPFRLCNALSTFTTFMNSIFHEKLNEFMIIYINDILMYFKISKRAHERFGICFM